MEIACLDACKARSNMSHLVAVVALLLFLPAVGFSGTKEIIAEGAYHMGDGETPSVAESRALLQAKRLAVEQAGTYVESYSKVKNLQLTEDEIQVLASGMMEVTVLDKKRSIAGDGFINFSVKIKAVVQPDKMEEMARKVKEKSVVEDYKKVQAAYAESQREIEELKSQLAQAKNEEDKARVEARISDEERMFQATEWVEQGKKHWLNDENDRAIDSYTKAIALNPNHAEAYYERGSSHAGEKRYDRAIEDYDKAIALDPNNVNAYFGRGAVFAEKRQYDKAVTNFQRACHLGDKDGCTLMEQELKRKMLLEWDPLKDPQYDLNREFEKELKKLKQRNE